MLEKSGQVCNYARLGLVTAYQAANLAVRGHLSHLLYALIKNRARAALSQVHVILILANMLCGVFNIAYSSFALLWPVTPICSLPVRFQLLWPVFAVRFRVPPADGARPAGVQAMMHVRSSISVPPFHSLAFT